MGVSILWKHFEKNGRDNLKTTMEARLDGTRSIMKLDWNAWEDCLEFWFYTEMHNNATKWKMFFISRWEFREALILRYNSWLLRLWVKSERS